MKLILNSINTLLLLGVLTMFSSCSGQIAQETTSSAPKSQAEMDSIGTTVSELDRNIPVVFQDSHDNYWFGSRNEGVYKYDGKSLTQFTPEDGLCGYRIRGIQEDQFGNIFFDTGVGVNKFDGQTIETLVLNNDSTHAWKLEPGDLWFGGKWNENGPYRYDGKQLYHLEFPGHVLESEVYSLNPNVTFSPYEVYTTEKDSKGNIWIGTSVLGACRYDGESLFWVSERDMTEIDEGPAPGVRSILEDKEGNFWFASNVNHKYKMVQNRKAGQKKELRYEILKGIDTAKEVDMPIFFMAMIQDNQGDIWMAGYGGEVWRFDGEELTFYPIKNGNNSVLIFTIYKDNRGELWLGTENAGAMKFNGKTFERFIP